VLIESIYPISCCYDSCESGVKVEATNFLRCMRAVVPILPILVSLLPNNDSLFCRTRKFMMNPRVDESSFCKMCLNKDRRLTVNLKLPDISRAFSEIFSQSAPHPHFTIKTLSIFSTYQSPTSATHNGRERCQTFLTPKTSQEHNG
jgi:hypothetical protein